MVEWRRARRWLEVEEVEESWRMGNGRGGAMVGPLIGFLFSIVAPQGLVEGMVIFMVSLIVQSKILHEVLKVLKRVL